MPTLLERVERLENLIERLKTVLTDFPGRTAEQLQTQQSQLSAHIAANDWGNSCGCRKCLKDKNDSATKMPFPNALFIVCPKCGNKRCPHASDHDFECTNSNESGQKGSVFA